MPSGQVSGTILPGGDPRDDGCCCCCWGAALLSTTWRRRRRWRPRIGFEAGPLGGWRRPIVLNYTDVYLHRHATDACPDLHCVYEHQLLTGVRTRACLRGSDSS